MPLLLPDDKIAQLSSAIQDGRKIYAIKLYRQYTGASLKDAKDAVEQLAADLHAQFPEKFPPPSTAKGCSPTAAMFLLAGGLVAYGLFKYFA